MGGVAVLRPQDVFNLDSNPMISPAIRSQSLRRRPTATIAHTPSTHKSSSSASNRTKRSPPKKNPSHLKDKEPSHNINTPKPRSTSRPKPRSTPKPMPNTNTNTKPAGTNTTTTNHNHLHLQLVMGQVKLLKRGETVPLSGGASPSPSSLHPPSYKDDAEEEVDMTPTKPEQLHVAGGRKKEVSLSSPADLRRIGFPDCYAGSAFVSSPPPSSLPVPAFFKKKNLVLVDAKTNGSSIDGATSDLLRLLRLDLS